MKRLIHVIREKNRDGLVRTLCGTNATELPGVLADGLRKYETATGWVYGVEPTNLMYGPTCNKCKVVAKAKKQRGETKWT